MVLEGMEWGDDGGGREVEVPEMFIYIPVCMYVCVSVREIIMYVLYGISSYERDEYMT